MVEATQSLLQRFKAKKAEKDSNALQEARRLVNLYRSLACFGDDFVGQYNQMLLAVKPGVRRLLATFMGGKEVEEYLEFLEQTAHLPVSDKGAEEMSVPQNKGYLPTPDEDMTVPKKDNSAPVPDTQWQEMQAQKEILVKQTQELLNALKKLEEKPAPVSQIQGTRTFEKPSSFDRYSEIIEDTAGGKNNE